MGEHFAADHHVAFHSRCGMDFVENQRPASCDGRFDDGAGFCGADSDGDAFSGAVVVLDFCGCGGSVYVDHGQQLVHGGAVSVLDGKLRVRCGDVEEERVRNSNN